MVVGVVGRTAVQVLQAVVVGALVNIVLITFLGVLVVKATMVVPMVCSIGVLQAGVAQALLVETFPLVVSAVMAVQA
jgi:uncharacterized membrane protein